MESYRNRLAVASHPTTGERASPAVLDRLIRSIWYLMSELRLKDAIGVPVPNKPSMLLAAIDQYDAAEILINNWLIDVEQQYPRLAIRMRLAGPESTVTARQSIAGESQPPGSVRISYDAVRKAVILDGEVIWMPDDDCAVRNASVS